eukprot:tig00020614_g12173.t1
MSGPEVIDLCDASDEEENAAKISSVQMDELDDLVVLASTTAASGASQDAAGSGTSATQSALDLEVLDLTDENAPLPPPKRRPQQPVHQYHFVGTLRSSVHLSRPDHPLIQLNDEPLAEVDRLNKTIINVKHSLTGSILGALEPRTATVLASYIRHAWIKIGLKVTAVPPKPIRGPARPISIHPITILLHSRASKFPHVSDTLRKHGISLIGPGNQQGSIRPSFVPASSMGRPELAPMLTQLPVRHIAEEVIQMRQDLEAELNSVYSFLKQEAEEMHMADPPPGLRSELFEYQRQAIHWMLTREEAEGEEGEAALGAALARRGRVPKKERAALQSAITAEVGEAVRRTCGGILADEMGLGKTIQIIALMLANPAGPIPLPALSSSSGPGPPPPAPAALPAPREGEGGPGERCGEGPRGSFLEALLGPGMKVEAGAGELPDPGISLDDIFAEVGIDLGSLAGPGPGPGAGSAPEPSPAPSSGGSTPREAPGAAKGKGKRRREAAAPAEGAPRAPAVPVKGTLIVCPLSTLSNWTTQLETHVEPGALTWYTYHGPNRRGDAAHLARFDVVLTTYTILQCEFEEEEGEAKGKGKGKGKGARRSPPASEEGGERAAGSPAPAAPELAAQQLPWAQAPLGPWDAPGVNLLGGAGALAEFPPLFSSFAVLGGPQPPAPAPPPPAPSPSGPSRPPRQAGAEEEAKGEGGWSGSGGRLGPLHAVRWHRVVLDEAHTIKTASTMQSKSACRLSARARWCLTGTPITNKLDDLQSLLQFLRARPLDEPGAWNRLIVQPIKQRDERGTARLRVVMQGLCMRRTKAEKRDGKAIVSLPPKEVLFVKLEPSPEEWELYQRVLQASKRIVASYLKEGTALKNYAHVLQLLLRLRQICDHVDLARRDGIDDPGAPPQDPPSLLAALRRSTELDCFKCGANSAGEPMAVTACAHLLCRDCFQRVVAPGRGPCPVCGAEVDPGQVLQGTGGEEAADEAARAACASTKLEALLLDLDRARREDAGVKAVVFTQWVAFMRLIQRALEAAGVSYVRLDGAMPAKQRAAAIDSFQKDPSVAVFLISLKAGGQGLNLTAASRVYLMDPWWHEACELQAIDRVHRVGQTRPVTVKRFIIRGSIEERILLLQARKRRVAEATLGPVGARSEAAQLRLEDLRLLLDLSEDSSTDLMPRVDDELVAQQQPREPQPAPQLPRPRQPQPAPAPAPRPRSRGAALPLLAPPPPPPPPALAPVLLPQQPRRRQQQQQQQQQQRAPPAATPPPRARPRPAPLPPAFLFSGPPAPSRTPRPPPLPRPQPPQPPQQQQQPPPPPPQQQQQPQEEAAPVGWAPFHHFDPFSAMPHSGDFTAAGFPPGMPPLGPPQFLAPPLFDGMGAWPL